MTIAPGVVYADGLPTVSCGTPKPLGVVKLSVSALGDAAVDLDVALDALGRVVADVGDVAFHVSASLSVLRQPKDCSVSLSEMFSRVDDQAVRVRAEREGAAR